MKLSEVYPDIERYLMNDCYCPGEIYERTNREFYVYDPDDECTPIVQTNDVTIIYMPPIEDTDYKKQMVVFWHDDYSKPGRIVEAVRIEATKYMYLNICRLYKVNIDNDILAMMGE